VTGLQDSRDDRATGRFREWDIDALKFAKN
jgi:hypothetical protein